MMKNEDVRELAQQPGLIWGFDFVDDEARAVSEAELVSPIPSEGFRWLHFNLADQRTRRWLTVHRPVSSATCELLTSAETAQHCLIDGDAVGLILHDFEHDFFETEPRMGVLRVAVGPRMIVTARFHPVRAAEAVKRRIASGSQVAGPADALELIFTAMIDGFRTVNIDLEAQVQAIEDELLKDHPAMDARTFTTLRSLMVRMHRMLGGARAVFRRLEDDVHLPKALEAPVERFVARLSSVDQDLLASQSQLRLLRDEMDLQSSQQTNETLYVLSILSALLLPATLVTGIFGMNTGGLPWTSHNMGSLWATGLAFASAGAVYVVLRWMGYIRR